MKHLFSPEGASALQQVLTGDVLLAFDYDGTLAPITEQYTDTRTPPAITHALEQLAQLRKVVIITGRSIADVTPRLGFKPYAVIGNHGAERSEGSGRLEYAALVAGWRATMEAQFAEAFRIAGVALEDKGCSLSLHYRQAHDMAAARQLILQACATLAPPARIFGGKCIVNIAPHGAPDKADALLSIAQTECASTAIFVGDDQNDEAVFERAPPHWLTVRIGQTQLSAARYFLSQQTEIQALIDTLLQQLQER